tara:strand:+ start:266 stop:772 length:507 start_codon:yes stop_codon:yes gene_type:complete
MNDKIVNKVANSDLITIDLADYSPKQTIAVFDVQNFLFEGVILKEKEFRKALNEFDFSIYSEKIVALQCSSEAIVPMWSYMLITSYLKNVATEIYFGGEKVVFQNLFLQNIKSIDSTEFTDKKVIVKGCGNIKLSESLYIAITNKLQNIVSSLMFGEACSSVPIFKKK